MSKRGVVQLSTGLKIQLSPLSEQLSGLRGLTPKLASLQAEQFAPSTAPFMVNYRVEDLHGLVKALRDEGCNVLDKIDDSEYGKFAWVIDPEGNKVELWQPPAGQ
jgi:hypothetical protein